MAATEHAPPVDTCALSISTRASSSGAGELSPDGARTPHPGSDGGFVLAMRFATASQFTFYSSFWTDDELVDEADADPSKDADGKFDAFVSAPATEIRGCLPGGCKTYSFASMGLATTTTLKDLFKNTPIGSSTNIRFGESTADIRLWAEYAGRNGWTENTGWMDSGINYDDDVSDYEARVRFGALFNNEGSINTVNDAIGFGATEADNHHVGAGAAIWPYKTFPMQGTIWVKADGWAAPSPTPSPAVQATGDPHLVNVHGQRFDVLQPGSHVLLHVPMGAHPSHALLRVVAEAQQLGGACADTYFVAVNITGRWAGPEARAHGTGDGRRGLVFHADGDAAARPDAAWMSFGTVSLKVVHGRTRAGAAYLNLYARNLLKAGYLVGGLLGEDDHTEVATPSSNCNRVVSLLSVRGRLL